MAEHIFTLASRTRVTAKILGRGQGLDPAHKGFADLVLTGVSRVLFN